MKDIHTSVICYRDTINQTPGWEIINDMELEEWKKQHPSYVPIMMFIANNDMLERNDYLAENFENQYEQYGLHPDSLNKLYKTSKGHTVRIKGIAARNRKYPIIVDDLTDSKRYKVSPSWVGNLSEI